MIDKKTPALGAQWLVRALGKKGITKERLLRDTGLNEKWLHQNQATISPENHLRIVENALDESGDPALGLNMGKTQNLTEFGFWGYAILSSKTLGEAARVTLQYWKITGSLVNIVKKSREDFEIWEIVKPWPIEETRLWRYAVEELLSTLYTANCFMTNKDLPFKSITLSYPEPAYSDLYQKYFKCDIYFDQQIDSCCTPKHYAKTPILTNNKQVMSACIEKCKEMATEWGKQDELIESINEIIISSSCSVMQLDEVAKKLHIGPRTLQRKLHRKGTTFQAIRDESRANLAKAYLLNTNLSMDQIADRVGFSETTHFRRGFKKWVGMTTREFKNRAKTPATESSPLAASLLNRQAAGKIVPL